MKILKLFLCLSLLYVSANDVNSATFQSGTDRFSPSAKSIGMSSYDFRINVIEHDGILMDAVENPLSQF